MIRYLDVCSGYSAFTLASAGLPFRCVGYSEIEPFPRAILEQRHGAVPVGWDHRHTPQSNITPLFGDFTRIEPHHVGPVDLLAGGTPCQTFSVAGKRLGLDDPRGNLTLEFMALARRLRVEWLAWENVPGFLSHDDGRTMGTFLGLLGELGYGWAYRVLDAQFIRVDGHARAVPQRRKRLFVVGRLGDPAGPAAVLFERESLRGDPAPRRQAGKGIAAATSPSLVSSGRGVERAGESHGQDPVVAACGALNTANGKTRPGDTLQCALSGHMIAYGGNRTSGPVEVASALQAHPGPAGRMDFASETFVAHLLRGEGFDAGEDGTGRGTPLVPIAYSIMPQNSGKDYKAREVEVAQPLMAGGQVGGNQGGDFIAQPIAFDTSQITSAANRSNPQPNDPCHPLSATAHPPALAFDARQTDVCISGDITAPLDTDAFSQAVLHQWAVRRPTPTECERLMAVPDGFTAITYRGKPAADGPRYKVLGNGQAVNCMRWIAHGLADVIAAQSKAAAAWPNPTPPATAGPGG